MSTQSPPFQRYSLFSKYARVPQRQREYVESVSSRRSSRLTCTSSIADNRPTGRKFGTTNETEAANGCPQ